MGEEKWSKVSVLERKGLATRGGGNVEYIVALVGRFFLTLGI